MKKFISLKIKFILFSIFLTGFSILIVTTALSQNTGNIILDRLKLEASDKAKLVGYYLNQRKNRLGAIAKSVAAFFDVQPYSAQRLFTDKKQRLNFLKKNGFSGMKLFDESDLKSAGKVDTNIKKIGLVVYQRAVPYVGIIKEATGHYRFVAFMPLYKLGKVIYLYDDFDSNFLYEIQTLVGSQVVIFNEKAKCWKTTIFKKDGIGYYRNFSVPKKRIKKLIKQADSYTGFELSVLGVRYVVSLHGIYDYWNRLIGFLGSMVLEYDAYEDLNDNYFISIVAALLIFVFIGLIAFYFISKIVRSYKEISIMSLEIAHGNLNKRISRIPNDELGELIISVNMMADSVKSSIELKKSLSKELRKHQLASGLSAEPSDIGQHYLREKSVFIEETQWKSLGRPLLVLSDSLQNCARISRHLDGQVDHVASQRVLLEMVEKGEYKAVIVDASSSHTPLKMLELKRKHSRLVKVPFFYR